LPNIEIEYTGDFYDEDYFENGKKSGKGWLSNYHWMPQRSFKEAFAFIDFLGLDHCDYILEVGTAKGFLVKALRILEIKADGCDISKYALSFAPEGCWNCSDEKSWDEHAGFGYTHILIKDMLEHLTHKQLPKMLNNFAKVADKLTCVIPMGHNGIYRIPEYHTEISHIIIENEIWWVGAFKKEGWEIAKDTNYLPGLKDNWAYVPNGNHVFSLERHV
jgi:cyclopropane fatty-acyl-phospholipid synthase-like methyltransferase